jgi:hypothetical protein
MACVVRTRHGGQSVQPRFQLRLNGEVPIWQRVRIYRAGRMGVKLITELLRPRPEAFPTAGFQASGSRVAAAALKRYKVKRIPSRTVRGSRHRLGTPSRGPLRLSTLVVDYPEARLKDRCRQRNREPRRESPIKTAEIGWPVYRIELGSCMAGRPSRDMTPTVQSWVPATSPHRTPDWYKGSTIHQVHEVGRTDRSAANKS